MNITNRLCNPSPFPVKWNYDKGVFLVIEPDGHLDLAVEVMDDFRSDKPGYEAIKSLMDQFGIFLRDPTRPYEHQAIEALEAYVKVNQMTYDDCRNNLRRAAAAQGTYDEKAFAETLEQMGYAALLERVNKAKARLEYYKEHVSEEKVIHERYDPERTLMCMDPPKEFDSKIAMQVYLDEHPETRATHEAWLAAQERASGTE